MDDLDTQRVIGDITVELTEISGSITKGITALSEKQFFDKDLSGTIKSVIETAVTQILQNKQYDDNLGETIKTAISEAASKIAEIKVDVSPVMKIGFEMIRQVKTMIDAFVSMPKPETNDSKYQEMLSVMVDVVNRNNEFMRRIIEEMRPKELPPTPQKQISKIDFIRKDDRIVTAVPSYIE